jgi:hypothetical protein
VRTDRQMDRHDEANSRFSQFVNAPKIQAVTVCHIPAEGCCSISETQSNFFLTYLYSAKLSPAHMFMCKEGGIYNLKCFVQKLNSTRYLPQSLKPHTEFPDATLSSLYWSPPFRLSARLRTVSNTCM